MTAIKKNRDFTTGPIFFRLTTFAIPIMLTGLLQTFYSMADNIVVGQFSGDPNALAAVGSTISISNLFINFLMGVALGAGIVVAQCIGAKMHDRASDAVHTAILLSVIAGLIMGAIGFAFSKSILVALGTKSELVESASLYLRIISVGLPAQTLYNFGAAILRSTGNSRTPLFILAASGLINVLFNLLFVIVFNMSVAGVATATIISQYISAIAVIITLMRRTDACRLVLSKLRTNLQILKRILALGLPSGIQSAVFAFANVLLTKAINTLTTAAVYAYTVVSNIDAITITITNSYQQAATTFTAQNYGAKDHARVVKSYGFSLIWAIIVSVFFGQLSLVFAEQISTLYISSDNPLKAEIIEAALPMMKVLLNTLPLLGIMNVSTGALRGVGRSFTSMIACIICVVGGRISWIYLAFPLERFNSPAGLMYSFPVSWILTSVVTTAILLVVLRGLKKEFTKENKQQ